MLLPPTCRQKPLYVCWLRHLRYHAAFRSKIAYFVILSIRFKATLFLIRSLRPCVRRYPGRRAGEALDPCAAPLLASSTSLVFGLPEE